MAETTMDEMVCGRNVLWPNRSVDETSRKHGNSSHGTLDETSKKFLIKKKKKNLKHIFIDELITYYIFFTIQYNIGFRNKRNVYINPFPSKMLKTDD